MLHGVNDTLVPVTMARDFVARLRSVSRSTVAYVELPRTQHAFDVLASIRCRHTTMGAVRFLEAIRARSGAGTLTEIAAETPTAEAEAPAETPAEAPRSKDPQRSTTW